jgi:ABC-type lipopolysaccharide export system ATPase subunit
VTTTAAVSQPGGLAGTDAMIEVEDVSKAFGSVQALASVSLHAQAGRVLGLLGPNGAGKTTLVRILTTLLQPDSGHARVAGLDIVRDAVALRSAIGLAGQYAAADEMLTGRENLRLVGQLYHLGRAERRQRAERVLEQFQLADAADRPVRTYSGGMRRRLDLAADLPLFLLVFGSSAFVLVRTLPGWLQAFANVQPVSVTVDAVRALSEGGTTLHWVWPSLAWTAGILLVFVPLAVRQYRRR